MTRTARVFSYLIVSIVAAILGAAAMHLIGKPSAHDLSLEQVRQLSPQEVAKKVLPALIQRLVDDTVDLGFTGSTTPEGAEFRLDSVELRLRAKGSGWRGICMADNLGIGLQEPPSPSGSKATQLKPNGQFAVRQTYRVVGDTTNDQEWSKTYQADLDAECARAGPGAVFFSLGDDNEMRTVADTLPVLRTLAEASELGSVAISCSGNAEACRNPQKVLKALRVDRIISANPVSDCNQGQACLDLGFMTDDRSPEASPPKVWVVRTRGIYKGAYPNGWGKILLSDLELTYR